jgi:hypothetical protein
MDAVEFRYPNPEGFWSIGDKVRNPASGFEGYITKILPSNLIEVTETREFRPTALVKVRSHHD